VEYLRFERISKPEIIIYDKNLICSLYGFLFKYDFDSEKWSNILVTFNHCFLVGGIKREAMQMKMARMATSVRRDKVLSAIMGRKNNDQGDNKVTVETEWAFGLFTDGQVIHFSDLFTTLSKDSELYSSEREEFKFKDHDYEVVYEQDNKGAVLLINDDTFKVCVDNRTFTGESKHCYKIVSS
jgi:hypothetical protein